MTKTPSSLQINELLSDMVTYQYLLSLPERKHFDTSFQNSTKTFLRDMNDPETVKNLWFQNYALIYSLIGENFLRTINKIQNMPYIVKPELMDIAQIIRSVNQSQPFTIGNKKALMELIPKLPTAFFEEFLFNQDGSPDTFLKQYLQELKKNKNQ